MNQDKSVTFSHIAMCSSNLERSARFYTEALGFILDRYVDVGPPFDTLTELPGIKGRAGFFLRDGVKVEFVEYESPTAIGSADRRPMNQLGLTHIGLIVENLDAVTERISQLGGQVHTETRISGPYGDMVFCTDPDGVRLELWEKTD